MAQAYIVEALRTAGGRRGGALRDWHPADLGAAVLDALVERSGIDPAAIEDVIAGCVGQIGEQSFHIGRNMVMASKLPDSVPAVSIDRQCGSSQQALHFAAQAVMSGTQDVVIASGVESMTRVPMGTPVILPMQAGIGTDFFEPGKRHRRESFVDLVKVDFLKPAARPIQGPPGSRNGLLQHDDGIAGGDREIVDAGERSQAMVIQGPFRNDQHTGRAVANLAGIAGRNDAIGNQRF